MEQKNEKTEEKEETDWTAAWKVPNNELVNNTNDDQFDWKFNDTEPANNQNSNDNQEISFNFKWDSKDNTNNDILKNENEEIISLPIEPINVSEMDEKDEHKNDNNNNDKNDALTLFINSLKKIYIKPTNSNNEASDDEDDERETKKYEQHNEFLQHLLDAAAQIQSSNKLSWKQKLIQKQLIANTIQIEDHKIKDPLYESGFDGDIPTELKKVIDHSLIIESALKQYRPSIAQVSDFITKVHSGKLDVSNPMHIVMYSINYCIKHRMIEQIYNAYALVTYSLGITACGKNKGDNEENEEDNDEIDQIVQLIMAKVFNTDSKDVKRPIGSSMYVRFDPTYRNKHYFVDDNFKNVYCGKLKFMSNLGVGDNYRIDCAGDLFAVCGGAGYKYRDPAMISSFIDPTTHKLKHICGGNRGFSSPESMVYCDSYHNRIWNSGDHRIKCSGIIDKNGQDTYCKKMNCEYILESVGKGILFSTPHKVFIFSSDGTFYSWTLNKLLQHKTDYFTDCCDDNDGIPEVDENGIPTQQYAIFENTSSDLECVDVEVSGGQKFHDKFKINNDLVTFKYAELSIINNVESKVFITNNNAIYSYDLNKNMLDGILLAHNGDSKIPFRQNIVESNSLLISHDCDVIKIWDIRDFEAKISINGCGCNSTLNSCVAFNVSGNVFVASGGRDEAVTIWDIRKTNGALYEISTGNNTVDQVIWHENSESLFVSTECEYIDRLGGKYYGTSLDPTSTFYGSDQEEDNDWPSRAIHHKTDFPLSFDCGENQVFRYKF